MARIRFKCPSINRPVLSSELAEENYQKNLLPVRDDLLPIDEVFHYNGDVERQKTLTLEVLTKYLQVLDNDHNPTMDVDVSYPTWIAEKLMLQLLPEPLVSSASDGGKLSIRPVQACVWFEDKTLTNDPTTYNSGGLCPMVQEMDLNVEDLLCQPTVQGKKLLVESSSLVDNGIDEDFKKLKVEDFEAAPISSPRTPTEETKLQKSIRGLDDAIPQTNSEADCRLVVKPFETQACDSGMCNPVWNFPELPYSPNVEPCATPMVQNSKADDCEDLSDDLSCLLDSFDPTPPMLDEHAPDLGTAMRSPQQRDNCSVFVSKTLLEDSSIDSSIKAMKSLQQIQNMSEKLQIIKNDGFEPSPSSKHRPCTDPGMKITSNSVVLVDLTGADDFSSSDHLTAHDTEEKDGIRHQERQFLIGTRASISTSVPGYEGSPYTAARNDNSLIGTRASVSTSVPGYEGSPYTAARNDNSDHSTLSDEKTTCSNAPPLYHFEFDYTRSASNLSLMSETHACNEVISQKKSSKADPKNCLLNQYSSRQEKNRLALEAIHQQRGSTSVAGASFEDIPWAVTAPPSAVSTAPLEHLKTEDLCIEKCLGSRDVKMMKKQPLVIVAANVMQPDGPVLTQRSSYQRILALENERLQVVERERHLPVDLILSPSTCLIVYTAATMKLNWEENPSLASKECSAFIVDIIVNCQMKAMSFSFEKCFMVFEGGTAFTLFILQAAQKLAVAAAGYGMQLQCFVSSSPHCTEEIALKCIERIGKTAKRPYPSLMSECENEDELFLEQFPSLNPLAAHAILCLNVPLSKFMLWSHDVMADALQGFEVPMESLKLFRLQSEYRKLNEGQGPRSSMRSKEMHPDNFASLPPAVSDFGDFETEFGYGLVRSNHRNSFFPSLDRIFEIEPLGDGPTSDEHSAFSPPFEPAFQMDPKFVEDFTTERCFNSWDDPYQLSEQEHLPVEPWPEKRLTQQAITQRNSNRSQKSGYIQSCLDEWIEKIKRDKSEPSHKKQESECPTFLDLAKAPIPSQARQQDLIPTLNLERHGREKVQIATINKTPAKRAASALDLFRHQKGISRPLQKKLKPLSRPHLRSAVVDISSVQAAQAQLSKRFRFKPVTNPSRFSRPS